MTSKDWYDRFIRMLETLKARYELDNIHDALILWYAENFLLISPNDILDRIVADRRTEGVDALFIDYIKLNLLFVQARTVENYGNTENNYPETDLTTTFEGLRLLLRGDYKGKITPNWENLVDEYHELDKTGDYSTTIRFLLLKKKPTDYKYVDSFKEEFEDIEVDFIDINDILGMYQEYLTLRVPAPEKISFEILTNLLEKESPYKSRLFTIKGKELAKVYNDYRETVFQQNLRYSLGMRSRSINKQICETSEDANNSKNFWYFNNGITIICEDIDETTSRKIINLRKAQIINGAQTTYALYKAYNEGTLQDNVEIVVRVIEINDIDVVESITLYTNSQNAINLRDLCSNDEIQRKIQRILLDSYGYFYERKRGEFDSLYPTPESKRNLLGGTYRVKVINNENAAQALLAIYLDKPAQAKNEKRRVFLRDDTGFYGDIFNATDECISEKLLMSWKLLKFIESKKKEYQKEYKSAEELPEREQEEIYRYDFLLHSEYFILNIFKDFLRNSGFDINNNREHMLEIVGRIDSGDEQLKEHNKTITNIMESFISEIKQELGYYHNKFFKSDTSIGRIRTYISENYSVQEV